MTLKSNHATQNRPAGSRPIDATNMLADIDNYINTIKQEDAWQKSDRNAITVFKTSGITIVLSGMHAGAVIDDYNRGGISTIQVLEGKIVFTSDGEEREATSGQLIITHRDGKYFIRALEDSFLLLTIKE
ncbi:hypothetical protein [Foetidibacter luteolus]|uniref:hypothetical protein n=1 Tax=Foetidibacter luteolus TaxID=2608880 RepID=UPI00129AEB8C|nr:hypothetical protein [Foetidibacter luteolus]